MKRRSKRRYLPRPEFWTHVFDWDGSGENKVTLTAVAFGLFAALVWFVDWVTPEDFSLGLAVAPYEFAGRDPGLACSSSGPTPGWIAGTRPASSGAGSSTRAGTWPSSSWPTAPTTLDWTREVVGWIAAFGHVARRSLRGQKNLEEIEQLVGLEETAKIARAEHKPTAVSLKIAELLREGRDSGHLDPYAYLKAEDQRALLIDHLGGCERISKTPLATAYVILIRRFIVVFLVTLPFALLRRVEWMTPFITLLVAYPILALDHIADDLQHPFSTKSINHLPLNDMTTTIETNVLGLLGEGDHHPAAPKPLDAEVLKS